MITYDCRCHLGCEGVMAGDEAIFYLIQEIITDITLGTVARISGKEFAFKKIKPLAEARAIFLCNLIDKCFISAQKIQFEE